MHIYDYSCLVLQIDGKLPRSPPPKALEGSATCLDVFDYPKHCYQPGSSRQIYRPVLVFIGSGRGLNMSLFVKLFV